MVDVVDGVAGIVIAYLLGSFPSAYVVTRLLIGKDIRKLGGGNVGARNVYEHVGLIPAIVVGVLDVAKGAGAVAIASIALLNAREWVLAAGLAVVIGHIWPVFLKFKGGNGIATSLGVLALLLTRELLVALIITFIILAFTRNPILSVNISLIVTMPIATFLIKTPWQPYLIFILILIAILVINFLPTARAALATAGSKEKLTADLLRIDQKKTGNNKKKKK